MGHAAEKEEAMSKLTYRKRKSLKPSDFVFPSERRFPIHDKAHARAALSRAGQKRSKLTARERCKVVAAVCSRYDDLPVCRGEGKGLLAKCEV